MLKYYSTFSKNIGINDKNATAEILTVKITVQQELKKSSKNKEKNSHLNTNGLILELRSNPIRSVSEFMDSLLELKRVHIERAKEITHVLVKTIRDFCFFDRDREVISNTTYDITAAGSAEKSDLKLLIEKFNTNVNQNRIFIVDLEHYCTTIVTQKLYELTSVCMNDRSLEKLNTKIITIDNLLNQLE